LNLPDYLTQDTAGHIYVTDHRVGLQDLMYYYNEGYSPEALQEAFPTLSLALIHRVIAFYLDNRAEVDAYVVTCEAEMERQRTVAPHGPDVTELRRRHAARQATGA
jgi:uncharacterized protein (DUF433 family)